MPFPVRFRRYEELTEPQKEARFKAYHFENLKAKDVKPLLREKFRPVLKASGFSRVSDSLSVRVVEPHYVHCLRLDFSATFLGRFFMRAGIATDVLPLSDWTSFNTKRLQLDADCLFTQDVTLSNGNPEFDNGNNLAEAHETIEYLIASFQQFDHDYFGRFRRFPDPLDRLDVEFVRNAPVVERTDYGMCSLNVFTLRLAMVHNFLGNTRQCQELLEYGLAHYKLHALKARYEQLLAELKGGNYAM
jgi:hypothetical protein